MAATPESFDSRERADYADAVGFIRVKEKRDLLSHGRLQEYLTLSADHILERLRQGLSGGEGPEDVDGLIGAILAEEYRQVERFDHLGLVVPLLRSRFDLHNLKAVLARRAGHDVPFAAVPGTIPPEMIEADPDGGRSFTWPEPVAECLAVLLRADQPLPAADALLDLAWIEHALDVARQNALSLVSNYYRSLGDVLAIRLSWQRISRQRLGLDLPAAAPPLYRLSPEILAARDPERLAEAIARSPYGPAVRAGLGEWRAGAPWMAVERDFDNLLVEDLAATRYVSLGPEPLFAFLVVREHDLGNLRLLHAARRRNWSDERVRRYLRRVHG